MRISLSRAVGGRDSASRKAVVKRAASSPGCWMTRSAREPGRLDEGRVVEQRQRLQRRVRADAAGAGRGRVGGVEDGQAGCGVARQK